MRYGTSIVERVGRRTMDPADRPALKYFFLVAECAGISRSWSWQARAFTEPGTQQRESLRSFCAVGGWDKSADTVG